jgi:methyl-accepting chemotaxis protein
VVQVIVSATEVQADATQTVNSDMEQLNSSAVNLTSDSRQLEEATDNLLAVGQ